MPEDTLEQQTAQQPTCESPPPAPQPPPQPEPDPRLRLHEMARELMRSRNRRLLVEFLELRRSFA